MDSINQIFLKAIEFFPRWMNIRRRPYKSEEGNLLSSVLDEYNQVRKAIEEYQKDFFLVSFLGHEDEILDKLCSAHVGTIDEFSKLKIENFDLTLTTDIQEFQKNTTTLYYQDGYILVRPRFVDKNHEYLSYEYNGYPYRIQWIPMHVWNVFDEFAWFAGLERFDEESNKDLCTRTISAFKNRTSITEEGLRNAITNIASDILSKAVITMEQPDEENMAIPYEEYGTVFEFLAQGNKDLARTKQWNLTYWQNNFKTLGFLPHLWDAQIKLYQDGVGYNDSLLVHTTDELSSTKTTDVSVIAYKKSKKAIEQYIQKNLIQKQLTLSLKKYKNILKTIPVQYRIKASNVVKLNPDTISFRGYQTSSNTEAQYISDIILDTQNITEIKKNAISANTEYQLLFYPNGPVNKNGDHCGTMQIGKCNLKDGNKTTSLLKPSDSFKIYKGIFQNTDVKFYSESIKNLVSYENAKDSDIGMTISDITRPARLVVDTSDIDNQYIIMYPDCSKIDYTTNDQFVSLTGHFSYEGSVISDVYNDVSSTVTIKMSSVKIFSFELLKEPDASKQGTLHLLIYENGTRREKDIFSAGTFSLSYDMPTDIVIQIQKSGMNPVHIKNIMAARFGFSVTGRNSKNEEIQLIHTPFGTLVPKEAQEVVVEMQAYGNSIPYLKYIHIGATLPDSTVYKIDNIKSINSGELDIDTNCRVTLVNKTTGQIVKNYTTKSSYRNDTNDNGIIYLDVSRYSQISSNVPKIYADAKTGDNYIVVSPGAEISRLLISGTSSRLCSVKTLSDVLNEQHISGYDCYVNQNISSIILYNKNSEQLFTLRKSYLEPSCDMYRISTGDNPVKPVFIQDTISSKIAYETKEPFVSISFNPDTYQEYIAYNTVKMFQPEVRHVQMTYNFSPVLSTSAFVLFQLTDIPDTITIEFEKQNGAASWSLGRKEQGIHIKMDMDQGNQQNYQIETKQLQQNFVIANAIQLQDEYTIDGETIRLAEYIVTPPDNMRIDYDTKEAIDDVRIESDGFTKLLYSNISVIQEIQVDGIILDPSKYSLLSDAGILVWNDENLYGKVATVTYTYLAPETMSFLSLDDLYNIVGYIVDAYEAINSTPDIYSNKKDGDTFMVSYPNADHLTLICSNDGFLAKSSKDNQLISVYAISDKNVVAVHNGYLYDSGKEYWMFADQYEEIPDHFEGVTFKNITRIPGKLLFNMESVNHVANSSMATSYLDTLCVVDFLTNKHIPEISKLQSISACDSFTGWHTFMMDKTLKEHGVGFNIVLTPDSLYSYAVLDITDYLNKDNIISLDITGTSDIWLCKDILLNNMHIRKAVYADPVEQFKDNQLKLTDYDNKAQYYLLIKGTPNTPITLSEIIISDTVIDDIHKKNIDKFGYIVTENRKKDALVPLGFTPSFARQNDIEFDRKGELMMGMTVDYGLTLLENIDFDDCQINRITYLKGVFQTQKELGTILTTFYKIPNFEALKSIDIKINDMLIDDTYKNYTVEILTSDMENGIFTTVLTKEDTNDIIVSSRYLKQYIRIRITMPEDSIIQSIQLFGEYYEGEYAPHVKYHNSGNMISKLFDTGFTSDYQLTKISASRIHDLDHIQFEIRGCREDDKALVWTPWEPITIDETLSVTSDNIFRGYRLFQLRVSLSSANCRIHIDGIIIKVVA